MKTVHCIALCAVTLVAGTVLAADPPAAAKSRAEVRQEAIKARAAGQTDVGDLPSYPAASAKTTPKASKRKTKRQDAKTASAAAAPEAGK